VAAHELEPHRDAHASDEIERIPRNEYVDVDVEPRPDAFELRRDGQRCAGHQSLRGTREETLDGDVQPAAQGCAYANAIQRRVVLRHREVRVVTANRQQEVARVRRRVPYTKCEIATQAEQVGVNEIRIR